MSKLLGLPPISPELKSISSYLQRANELKATEPVMAYWCAYHAAQLGISLKAKDTLSRNFLFELLGALEYMKKEIGPSDAVDVESASAAYVENFALKVFAMADNEDRRDQATRSTAKKFLAAANFLEVLKVFPKSEISELNEEKIRYAKWKAADIAKAFREGRKPVSGPAGQPGQTSPPESENTPSVGSTSTSNSYAFEPVPGGPRVSPSPPLPPHITPSLKRTSPPPHMDKADIFSANGYLDPHTPPRRQLRVSVQDEEADEPDGPWSTVATPGSARPSNSGVDGYSPNVTPIRKGTRGESSLKTAWVSGELEGVSSSDEDGGGVSMRTNGYGNGGAGAKSLGIPANPNIRKVVHFTPSVTGGSSVSGSPPISPGFSDTSTSDSPATGHIRSSSLSSPAPPTIPQNVHPFASPRRESVDLPYPPQPPQTGASAHFAPVFSQGANANVDAGWLPPTNQVQPPVSPPPVHPSNGPPSITYQSSSLKPPSPPPSPPRAGPSHSSSPPQPSYQQPRYLPPPPPPPPAPVHVPVSPPPELTPSIIAKAQKHCRFAISALDYEDAEQARKELHAALAVLDG